MHLEDSNKTSPQYVRGLIGIKGVGVFAVQKFIWLHWRHMEVQRSLGNICGHVKDCVRESLTKTGAFYSCSNNDHSFTEQQPWAMEQCQSEGKQVLSNKSKGSKNIRATCEKLNIPLEGNTKRIRSFRFALLFHYKRQMPVPWEREDTDFEPVDRLTRTSQEVGQL